MGPIAAVVSAGGALFGFCSMGCARVPSGQGKRDLEDRVGRRRVAHLLTSDIMIARPRRGRLGTMTTCDTREVTQWLPVCQGRSVPLSAETCIQIRPKAVERYRIQYSYCSVSCWYIAFTFPCPCQASSPQPLALRVHRHAPNRHVRAPQTRVLDAVARLADAALEDLLHHVDVLGRAKDVLQLLFRWRPEDSLRALVREEHLECCHNALACADNAISRRGTHSRRLLSMGLCCARGKRVSRPRTRAVNQSHLRVCGTK